MLKRIGLGTKGWALENKKKLPQTSHDIKKITMCKTCYTFYYKRSWHFERPAYLDFNHEEEVPVRFTECPACVEQEVALYETESNLVLGSG